jgi:hypothetical protein
MLNHNQTAMVLVIALVAVLMTLASTRVFAQHLPAHEHNKVNNALQSEENKVIAEAQREAQIKAQIQAEREAQIKADIEAQIKP